VKKERPVHEDYGCCINLLMRAGVPNKRAVVAAAVLLDHDIDVPVCPACEEAVEFARMGSL